MPPVQETTQPIHLIDFKLWEAFTACPDCKGGGVMEVFLNGKKESEGKCLSCDGVGRKKKLELEYWWPVWATHYANDTGPFICRYGECGGYTVYVCPAIMHSTDLQIAILKATGYVWEWLPEAADKFSFWKPEYYRDVKHANNPFEALKVILLKDKPCPYCKGESVLTDGKDCPHCDPNGAVPINYDFCPTCDLTPGKLCKGCAERLTGFTQDYTQEFKPDPPKR